MRRRLFGSVLVALVLPSLLGAGSLRLEKISGNVALTRPGGEPWPLEEGQRLLEGGSLRLEEGASVLLRYLRHNRVRVDGPQTLRVAKLVEPMEDDSVTPSLLLQSNGGVIGMDTRFQFERPMELRVERGGRNWTVDAGSQWLMLEDSKGREQWALVDDGRLKMADASGTKLVPREKQKAKEIQLFPRPVRRWLEEAQTILILARDYDRDRDKWPRPGVLGAVLVRELGSSFPRQLTLVDGSGDTYVARRANNAIKTGNDTWLRKLGLDMGARWILAGNLVVRDPDLDRGAGAPRNPKVFRARAEARLLETDPDGDVLVSEAANTTVARVGRPRDASRRLALEGAAEKLAGHLRFHFGDLLKGRSHPRKLMSFTFNNVSAEALGRLKKAIGELDSVQRMFSRRFSNGIYKVDLVPRRQEADLARAVDGIEIRGFQLQASGKDPAGSIVYTLRKR